MGGKKSGAKSSHYMADHEIPYAATASTAYPDDFRAQAPKSHAGEKTGWPYIHLLSPCPTGWRFPSEKGIEIARLAVETNFSPCGNGKEEFTGSPSRSRSPNLWKSPGKNGEIPPPEPKQIQEIRPLWRKIKYSAIPNKKFTGGNLCR